MQIGLFKIPEMKKKIMEISMNYDVIIFHLIRSAYYLPKNYSGKKILEMKSSSSCSTCLVATWNEANKANRIRDGSFSSHILILIKLL